ncbi:MAG TPA: hypothetical protein VFB60_03705 [Ktedonobacteraceae bacterium]|nr:hypothetical protein [Ktedonobacteraceae bacterium]
MQDALANRHVKIIVDILLQCVADDFFILVSQFLKKHGQNTSTGFLEDLQALRLYSQRRLDEQGQFIHVSQSDEICKALEGLYNGTQIAVNFRRGAIAELLAYELVRSRCQDNECQGNHRFIKRSNRYESDQVDVAVLSEIYVEGYTCKLKSTGIMSEDCTNLSTLSEVADELGYLVHVGAICFDNSKMIRQRLRRFPATEMIMPYGLDNLSRLRKSLFEEFID